MIGVGTDIVAVARIADLLARHGERFSKRCFRPDEIALAQARGPRQAATLAARWAAKEAFLKSLGLVTDGIAYRDIEVVRDASGRPTLRLYATAAAALATAGARSTHLSVSHEDAYAVAVVVLE